MAIASHPPAARRLSPEDWIAFAKKALVQSGIEGVKIDRLAKKARVTRGSFYWHFGERKDLLNALLRDWEVRNQVEVAIIRDRWAREAPDLTDVALIWLSEDRSFLDFDHAIRSWARQSAEVEDVVRRVDSAWIGLLQTLFQHAGCEGDDCLVRARITYFHQIGYHALAFAEERNERLRLVPHYYRALTGREPTERLIKTLAAMKENGGKKGSRRTKPPPA